MLSVMQERPKEKVDMQNCIVAVIEKCKGTVDSSQDTNEIHDRLLCFLVSVQVLPVAFFVWCRIWRRR